MTSGFQQPITIKDAIDKIHNRYFLLPAIQRKFTWSSTQIEMLFDSILRGYPINSFMFWKISDNSIKSSYKFYQFLTEFREFFAENNLDIDTRAVSDFESVIDGQQRLTSLYLGLKGTYAYKLPRKWWKNNEECIPTRKLYLNLVAPVKQEYDNQNSYDFRFLSQNDLERINNSEEPKFWFEVGKILDFDDNSKVYQYLYSNNLFNNNYATKTLSKLYEVIHLKPLINYYLHEEQDPDKILDIFIRTNSGGTPLSFSDLLMSIASANWKKIDARKEIDKLIIEINSIGKPGFLVDKDFILKSCLVLFVDNINFVLKNFTYENIEKFENNWDYVKKSIVSSFKLFEQLGFNNTSFRAKNAAIPVIYYIYKHQIADAIVKDSYNLEDKKNISKWLVLTFIKSVFAGQSDSVLTAMRKVINENLNKNYFPIQEIISHFKNNPTKNYTFDEEFFDGLLEAQKDTNDAFYVLHLMYPDLRYDNQEFHQDHLHPETIFKDSKKFDSLLIPKEDQEFARDPKNWNSVSNLQFLSGHDNESKNKSMLCDWVKKYNKSKKELFLNDTTSLDIKDFKEFILQRRQVIKQHLKDILACN